MPKYVAIHPVEPPVDKEAVASVATKCKASLSTDAYWVKSWLQLDESGRVSRVFCEWDSKDEETLRKTLLASIPELPPTEGVFEITEICNPNTNFIPVWIKHGLENPSFKEGFRTPEHVLLFQARDLQ